MCVFISSGVYTVVYIFIPRQISLTVHEHFSKQRKTRSSFDGNKKQTGDKHRKIKLFCRKH